MAAEKDGDNRHSARLCAEKKCDESERSLGMSFKSEQIRKMRLIAKQ